MLSEKVIVNYVSKIEPERMAKFNPGGITDSDSVYDYGISDYAVDPEWATLFMNATGCLRYMEFKVLCCLFVGGFCVSFKCYTVYNLVHMYSPKGMLRSYK